MFDYINLLQIIDKTCIEFEEKAAKFYRSTEHPDQIAVHKWFCYTPVYREFLEPIKRLIEICDIFGIEELELNKEFLRQMVSKLENPEEVKWRTSFTQTLIYIKYLFNGIKKDAYELNKILSSPIKRRLNEAIHCFLEECYYSAVIMSVSAMETKLLAMMKKVNPEKEEKLDKLTLGQLINEYLQNEKEFKHIIPDKYKPLLKLCNIYRIFSVHPKEEKITRRIATSILNLTFEFLTDKTLLKKNEVA